MVSTIAGTVTPISTRTGRAGKPVSVGVYSCPTSITFAPGSATAVVLNTYAGTVSLVNARTHRAARAHGRRLPGRGCGDTLSGRRRPGQWRHDDRPGHAARATALVPAALYESYYLTASDPASARALWLRYTAASGPDSRRIRRCG